MKRIWSPWRSKHIERVAADPDGYGRELFVEIGADSANDNENFVLWRGESVYVVMNLYPYNNGHLLIVPFRAVAGYHELTSAEQTEIASTIDRCIRWLQRALRPEGFNVGMNIGKAAGAGIPDHLHIHVVPRWTGDTSFMPAVADLRVIPESMEETFRRLKTAVEALQDD